MKTKTDQAEEAEALRLLMGEDAPAAPDTNVYIGGVKFTAEEAAELRAQARADVEETRKENARKMFLREEKERLRQEEGLTTGSRTKDEMVSIVLDLAEHSNRIILANRAYYHGQIYTVPRHIADTLREVMFRGWKHQAEIDGEDRQQFYQRQRLTKVSMVGGKETNAPSRFDAE